MTLSTGAEPDSVARPAVLASFEVRLAALMMPSADSRDRDQHEFIAELYGLRRPHQITHATRILMSAWALRMALSSDAHRRVATEATMTGPATSTAVRRGIRCRLNVHHWVWRSTEDGARYRLCSRCGKDDFRVSDPGDGNAVPPGAF